MLVIGRRFHDDADCSAGMKHEPGGARHIDERHDLGSDRVDQVRSMQIILAPSRKDAKELKAVYEACHAILD